MKEKNYIITTNLKGKIQNYLQKAIAKGDNCDIEELQFLASEFAILNKRFLERFGPPED